MSTHTDTQLSITLAAIAEHLRSQADTQRADDAARQLAEYRATVAELLAAAETVPAGELSPATLDQLATSADSAAAGDMVACDLITGWRSGARTLPRALYDQCPAAHERAMRQASNYIEDPRIYGRPNDMHLLPDDVRERVEEFSDAERAMNEQREAKRRALNEEHAAERRATEERKACQLDALARHYLSDDPEVIAGWEAGEIRTQEATGRAYDEMTDGLTRRKGDTCAQVERVSVPAYQAQRRVLARITDAAQRIGAALCLPVTVGRGGYYRHRVTQWVEDDTRVERWYAADYTVTIGDIVWSIEDVVLV